MTTPVLMQRSDWTHDGPAAPLLPLEAADVVGITLHWPGEAGSLAALSEDQVAAKLEGYRRFHVESRKWSDVAYNEAIDHAGRVWPLRGLGYRSAANGDGPTNRANVAFLLMVGPEDVPSEAMVDAVRWRRAAVLERYPTAYLVRGHRDVRPEPTECPGRHVMKLVAGGAFTAPRTPAAPVPFVLARQLKLDHPPMRGKDVHRLQVELERRGIRLRRFGADSIFGTETEAGVRTLQRRAGLDPDGIVGRLTATKALGWGWAR